MDVLVLVTMMASLMLVVTAEEQSCLSFFQMSGSTIIRTVDSRKRGAKYINETNAATKEECANLCCETNDCTVAVFEGKKPGGCYLFDCGLTDNFLCKFTSHEHYVSYVMKVNRHQFDLQTWKKHAKHEQELNSLRPSTPAKLSIVPPAPSTSSTSPITSTTSSSTSTSSTPAVPKTTESKCTPFQFKCQGSGDCIAVYNACDGIPQCADGSDEKPGLGCPITTTSASVLLQQSKGAEGGNPVSSVHAMQAMNNLAPPPPMQNYQRDEYNQKQVGRMSQASDPQEIFVHRDGGLIRDEGALHYPNRAHGVNKLGYVDQDRQPYIQYPGYPPLPPQPNREGFAYNSSPSREETPSLFRGSLPRETGSSFSPAIDRGNPTPFREESARYHDSRVDRIPYTEQKSRYRLPDDRPPDPYPGPSGREGVPIYREGAPVYSETLQKDAVSYGAPAGRKSSSGYGGVGGYGMEEYEYKHPHYVPEQWRPPEESSIHRNTEEWKSSEVPNQRGPFGSLPMDPGQVIVRDGPKKGFIPHVPHVEETQEVPKEDPHNYHNAEHKDLVAEDMKHSQVEPWSKPVLTTAVSESTELATEATTTKTKKVVATEAPVNKTENVGGHPDKAASKAEKLQKLETDDVMDGHTRRFSGAVTIVVLGCLVTMALLLVITCRLRAVRARLRRGGLSPYAHDADYLVNGMYL